MNKVSKKLKIFFIIVLVVGIIIVFCIWQNDSVIITNINYTNNKIPNEFNEYKIAQISDLHNKKFGKNQKYLIRKIKEVSPDIIVVTGDLVDRRTYNLEVAMELINEAIKIAPIYYVSGNHEAWSGKYNEISQRLTNSGVIILDDTFAQISKNNYKIAIMGLSDPGFVTSQYSNETNTSKLEENIKTLSNNEEFKILLSHRPELFDIYVNNKLDLVFTGHAHGGQIRLPFIGAIIAPNQGFFPKYTSGEYKKDNTSMIVNRGLGNSTFPIRIFNRPEIVVVTMKTK